MQVIRNEDVSHLAVATEAVREVRDNWIKSMRGESIDAVYAGSSREQMHMANIYDIEYRVLSDLVERLRRN